MLWINKCIRIWCGSGGRSNDFWGKGKG